MEYIDETVLSFLYQLFTQAVTRFPLKFSNKIAEKSNETLLKFVVGAISKNHVTYVAAGRGETNISNNYVV